MRSFFRPSASPAGSPDAVLVVSAAAAAGEDAAMVVDAEDEEDEEEEEAIRLVAATHSSTIWGKNTPSCLRRVFSFACAQESKQPTQKQKKSGPNETPQPGEWKTEKIHADRHTSTFKHRHLTRRHTHTYAHASTRTHTHAHART